MTADTRKGIISFTITDRGALYSSYLPFVRNGGLFVPTARPYALGDSVFLLLGLMKDVALLPVAGTVVWVTPSGAQGNKTAGIGVRFAEEDEGATRTAIERHLGGALQGERPTQTM